MNNVKRWMSWESGVDLVGSTRSGLPMPNVIAHVAKMVHTPVGSAPAGLIFWQPDPAAAPAIMGYISTDLSVGKYFGPNIFAGTPFEHAPVLQASIVVEANPDNAVARVTVEGFTFESRLSGLAEAQMINRAPSAGFPFFQQGMEATAAKAEWLVNGQKISLLIPPVGISGGPSTVVSACGIYAR